MNFLVIPGRQERNVSILGDRAKELIEAHDLSEDITVAALEYGGKRGKAKVLKCERDCLELEVDLYEEPLAKKDLHLLVGLCRPQTVKKVISASFALGAKELSFLLSENSEKSYLQSKIWKSENLEHEIMLGMAQTGDSLPLKINVTRDWSKLELKTEKRMCFDSSGKNSKGFEHPLVAAIGPEKGWSAQELGFFKDHEFQIVSLGERMLRVEHAIMSLL